MGRLPDAIIKPFFAYADHARGTDLLIATVLQNCHDLHQRAELGTAVWGNDWALRRAKDLDALLRALDAWSQSASR